MFENRRDAGEKLAEPLMHYKDSNALVLAIPRGGVVTGYYVAQRLNLELGIVVSRKLPFPDNPEAGFGALAEDGSLYLTAHAEKYLSQETISRIIERQRAEIERRIASCRGGEPLPEIEGRTVILVDDGIAMGSTLRGAIMLCRRKKAGEVIVATPVAGEDSAAEISLLADDLVVLEIPPYFYAVAQVYREWDDVPDEEVAGLMERHREERAAKK